MGTESISYSNLEKVNQPVFQQLRSLDEELEKARGLPNTPGEFAAADVAAIDNLVPGAVKLVRLVVESPSNTAFAMGLKPIMDALRSNVGTARAKEYQTAMTAMNGIGLSATVQAAFARQVADAGPGAGDAFKTAIEAMDSKQSPDVRAGVAADVACAGPGAASAFVSIYTAMLGTAQPPDDRARAAQQEAIHLFPPSSQSDCSRGERG